MTCYLLHFDRKLSHAQHYLGYADRKLENRIKQHRTGKGASLTRAAVEAGITLNLVRTWEGGDRTLERQLKRRKNSPKLCPICNP